jgi:hypothetical protein
MDLIDWLLLIGFGTVYALADLGCRRCQRRK